MSKIHKSIEEVIGHTPLIEAVHLEQEYKLGAAVLVKPEGLNPGGSAKDRAALYMINDAENKGRLKPGGTIIEPTSGNTGIGLCMIGAARGYHVVIVMPDSMSVERQRLMKAYGAELILTPGAEGMSGAIAKAKELEASLPGSIIAGQFENRANAEAHIGTTGPEIWEDTDGNVDILVVSVGTGGTITGTGEYLKSVKPSIHVVAVEPAGSPVLSGGTPGRHNLQGIGAGFIPELLNTGIYDEIIQVREEDAYAYGRFMAAREGILCGISSGACVWAAAQLAGKPENAGKNIVVILPDTGERYLTTEMFA